VADRHAVLRPREPQDPRTPAANPGGRTISPRSARTRRRATERNRQRTTRTPAAGNGAAAAPAGRGPREFDSGELRRGKDASHRHGPHDGTTGHSGTRSAALAGVLQRRAAKAGGHRPQSGQRHVEDRDPRPSRSGVGTHLAAEVPGVLPGAGPGGGERTGDRLFAGAAGRPLPISRGIAVALGAARVGHGAPAGDVRRERDRGRGRSHEAQRPRGRGLPHAADRLGPGRERHPAPGGLQQRAGRRKDHRGRQPGHRLRPIGETDAVDRRRHASPRVDAPARLAGREGTLHVTAPGHADGRGRRSQRPAFADRKPGRAPRRTAPHEPHGAADRRTVLRLPCLGGDALPSSAGSSTVCCW